MKYRIILTILILSILLLSSCTPDNKITVFEASNELTNAEIRMAPDYADAVIVNDKEDTEKIISAVNSSVISIVKEIEKDEIQAGGWYFSINLSSGDSLLYSKDGNITVKDKNGRTVIYKISADFETEIEKIYNKYSTEKVTDNF